MPSPLLAGYLGHLLWPPSSLMTLGPGKEHTNMFFTYIKIGFHVGPGQWITNLIARPANLGRDLELQAAMVVGPDGQTGTPEICMKIMGAHEK